MADCIGWHGVLRLPAVALLAWALAGLAGCEPAAEADRQRVTIGSRTFRLELALDEEARYQGLSDRESIAADGGMLFVFPDAEERGFVMRRCPVPIDIIFLDPGGRVVAQHAMQVEPNPDAPDEELKRYRSRYPAQFAIELKGGTLDTLGIRNGDRIDLPLSELKARAR